MAILVLVPMRTTEEIKEIEEMTIPTIHPNEINPHRTVTMLTEIEIEIAIGDTISSRGAKREHSTTSTGEIRTLPSTATATGTMVEGVRIIPSGVRHG